MCLRVSYKKKIWEKSFFFLHPLSQWRKESDPELDPDPHQNVTDPQHCSEVSRIRVHISQLQPLAAMMGLDLVSADRTRLLQAVSRIGIHPVSFPYDVNCGGPGKIIFDPNPDP